MEHTVIQKYKKRIKPVVIAVLDTGIKEGHPNLEEVLLPEHSKCFIRDIYGNRRKYGSKYMTRVMRKQALRSVSYQKKDGRAWPHLPILLLA